MKKYYVRNTKAKQNVLKEEEKTSTCHSAESGLLLLSLRVPMFQFQTNYETHKKKY